MVRIGRRGATIACCAVLAAAVQVPAPAAAPGALDRTYGYEGVAVAGFATPAGGNAIAIDRAGRAVVQGNVSRPGFAGWDLALARFTRAGFADRTFGRDGTVTIRFDDEAGTRRVGTPRGAAVLAGPGNAITAVSQTYVRSPDGICCARIVVARVTADGRLDRSFGTGGRLQADPFPAPGNGEFLEEAVLGEDGSLLIAGTLDTGAGAFLARYRRDGAVDPSFGVGGVIVAPPPMLVIVDIALDGKGRIVGAGSSVGSTGGFTVVVCRWTPDGALDESYGARGCATTDDGARDMTATGVALTPDGAYVVGEGRISEGRWIVARLDRSGAVVRRFGRGGFVELRTPGASIATGIAVAGERTWVVGSSASCDEEGLCFIEGGLVARVDASGRPDRALGRRGIASLTADVVTAWDVVTWRGAAFLAVAANVFGYELGAAKIVA